MLPETDPVASALAEIRERQARLGSARQGSHYDPLIAVIYEDAPRLLAAIDAVLKAAEKWDERARTLFVVAQQMQQGPGSGREYSRALAYDKCSRALREAITAELAGKASDGR